VDGKAAIGGFECLDGGRAYDPLSGAVLADFLRALEAKP